MTNAELAAAIDYAYQHTSNELGGYSFESRNTERDKVMLEHLKELLAEQSKRAKG